MYVPAFALLPLFVTAVVSKTSWEILGSKDAHCGGELTKVDGVHHGGSCQPLEGYKSFAFLGGIEHRVKYGLKLWSDDECTKPIDHNGDDCIGEDITRKGGLYFTVCANGIKRLVRFGIWLT